MPYIPQVRRPAVTPYARPALTAGELNYQLTVLIRNYLEKNGRKYATCNDIIGALDAAKMEFYRRVVSKLEDEKIVENGDVYR